MPSDISDRSWKRWAATPRCLSGSTDKTASKAIRTRNYGRELFELFSLGVGNYTETDIQEAARALTGWKLDGDRAVFAADRHDDGEKTVFGQRGAWRDTDIVRIVLEQPAAARFLAQALFRQFVSEEARPPDELIEPLARFFAKAITTSPAACAQSCSPSCSTAIMSGDRESKDLWNTQSSYCESSMPRCPSKISRPRWTA